MDVNLSACLKSGLDAIPQREDATDGKLHVSDISNGCTRFVWNNKKKKITKDFSAEEKLKFQFGFSAEQIWKQYGEPELLKAGWVFIKTAAEGFEFEGVIGHEDFLYGHLDGRRLLIEVKSTVFFNNGMYVAWLPDYEYLHRNNTNYFIQAAGYAHAEACDIAKVLLVHRGSGVFRDYPVDLEKDYAEYVLRKGIMESVVASDREPEPRLPPWTIEKNTKSKYYKTSYLCKSCPVVTCEFNAVNVGKAIA